MEFTLTIRERYTLERLLPTVGNHSRLSRCQELRDVLEATDAEKDTFGMTDIKDKDGYPTGAVRLPLEKDRTECAISVGQHVFDMIVEILKKLNETDKLDARQLTLYEKFVDPGPVKTEKPA